LISHLDLFVSCPRHVYNLVFSCLPRSPIVHSLSLGNVSLDPTNAAPPRYDSAATLSPWHPLVCRGAKLTRRCALSLSSRLLREALLVAKLLLAASPAFDRSPRIPLSSCAPLSCGLSPGEHNFDPLGGATHCWTTWNPPKYAAQRARPFACHYHTHATAIRGRSADRIAEVEAVALEDGKRAGGKNVYSVYAIRFTTPRPDEAKRFTSFAWRSPATPRLRLSH